MSISIYKPTVKNSGSGFSFQMGIDSKSKEPTLFVKSILQHSWDAQKRQGYFKENLDNPDKNFLSSRSGIFSMRSELEPFTARSMLTEQIRLVLNFPLGKRKVKNLSKIKMVSGRISGLMFQPSVYHLLEILLRVSL